MESKWLQRSRRLAAIAQNGLTYAKDVFDIERYTQLREIAAEMLAEDAGSEVSPVRDLLSSEIGYATPKLDIRGVVFRDDTILMVRETSDGGWSLPGGWVDVGESPSEAVVKEVFEESGFRTRAVKMLAVLDRDRHGHPSLAFHVYKVFIRCEIVGGAPALSIETDGVAFFHETELPPLSLTRLVPSQVKLLFQHWRNPDRPTDFD
jgi:ADP-ribose pyrophosphatase YjhB (NUDIX family)